MTVLAPEGLRESPARSEAIGSVGDLRDVLAMLTSEDGLDIKDHIQHTHRYRACFPGAALATFLVERLCLPRAQAVATAQRLEFLRYIVRVDGVRGYTDDSQLYGIGPGPADQIRVGSALTQEPLAELAGLMRGKSGVGVGPRYRGFVRYPDCFTGRDATRWIALHCTLSFGQAIEVGQAMQRANLIRHVYDDEDFRGDKCLFRFV